DREVSVTLNVLPGLDPGIVQDDFDRSDGGLGSNWTTDPSWGPGLTISGNKVITSNSGGVYWAANNFGADQSSQIRLGGTINNWSGVIVRGNVRPAPFYLARVNANGVDLYSWMGGSLRALGHDSSGWANGDLLRLEVRTVAQATAHLTVY